MEVKELMGAKHAPQADSRGQCTDLTCCCCRYEVRGEDRVQIHPKFRAQHLDLLCPFRSSRVIKKHYFTKSRIKSCGARGCPERPVPEHNQGTHQKIRRWGGHPGTPGGRRGMEKLMRGKGGQTEERGRGRVPLATGQ